MAVLDQAVVKMTKWESKI